MTAREAGNIRDRRPWPAVLRRLRAAPARGLNAFLILLVHAYRYVLAPFFGGHCRFHPTCSEYAIEALRLHGPWRGTGLTFRRLLRCRPGGPWGPDPVPPPVVRRLCAHGHVVGSPAQEG